MQVELCSKRYFQMGLPAGYYFLEKGGDIPKPGLILHFRKREVLKHAEM